ncbi:MAG: hypothetical protein AAGA30_02495 [Planctomycetota bacterium]
MRIQLFIILVLACLFSGLIGCSAKRKAAKIAAPSTYWQGCDDCDSSDSKCDSGDPSNFVSDKRPVAQFDANGIRQHQVDGHSAEVESQPNNLRGIYPPVDDSVRQKQDSLEQLQSSIPPTPPDFKSRVDALIKSNGDRKSSLPSRSDRTDIPNRRFLRDMEKTAEEYRKSSTINEGRWNRKEFQNPLPDFVTGNDVEDASELPASELPQASPFESAIPNSLAPGEAGNDFLPVETGADSKNVKENLEIESNSNDFQGTSIPAPATAPLVRDEVLDQPNLNSSPVAETENVENIQETERGEESNSNSDITLGMDAGLDAMPDPKFETFKLQDLFEDVSGDPQVLVREQKEVEWGAPKVKHPFKKKRRPKRDSGKKKTSNADDEAPREQEKSIRSGPPEMSQVAPRRPERNIVNAIRNSTMPSKIVFDNLPEIKEQRTTEPAIVLRANPVERYHELRELRIASQDNQSKINANIQSIQSEIEYSTEEILRPSTPNRLRAIQVGTPSKSPSGLVLPTSRDVSRSFSMPVMKSSFGSQEFGMPKQSAATTMHGSVPALTTQTSSRGNLAAPRSSSSGFELFDSDIKIHNEVPTQIDDETGEIVLRAVKKEAENKASVDSIISKDTKAKIKLVDPAK